MKARRGFTLLELLVVLMILGITAVAAVPMLASASTAPAEQQTAAEIGSALTAVRAAARETGSIATLTLSSADGRYWASTRSASTSGTIPLAPGVSITSATADRIECHFEPAGRARCPEIAVRAARTFVVAVNRWSGEIRVDERRP